jgi:biopolymer transport protein TolR
MAFSGGKKGGFSDINITPMVDVMLVLLIIFMVAAPMIHQGESINLPKTSSKMVPTDNEKYITMSIDKSKKILIDGQVVEFDNLKKEILSNAKLQEKKEIYLEADKTIPYGFVVKIMSVVRNSGVSNINLITESENL